MFVLIINDKPSFYDNDKKKLKEKFVEIYCELLSKQKQYEKCLDKYNERFDVISQCYDDNCFVKIDTTFVWNKRNVNIQNKKLRDKFENEYKKNCERRIIVYELRNKQDNMLDKKYFPKGVESVEHRIPNHKIVKVEGL